MSAVLMCRDFVMVYFVFWGKHIVSITTLNRKHYNIY